MKRFDILNTRLLGGHFIKYDYDGYWRESQNIYKYLLDIKIKYECCTVNCNCLRNRIKRFD